MEETDPYTTKLQNLGSKVAPNHANPSLFHNNFLYKAALVIIFVVVLPLFPSQAPEFINQTLHTRSWELVQLLFVGIAVCYGLFSRRNDEAEKEYSSKFDNAQSYVSRFLQVSSVFDDEAENPSVSDDNKVQTWNSQYHRGEPVVVVAPESSVLEEQRGTSSRIGEKPLLLPVRSLKSRVSDSGFIKSGESSVKTGSLGRSNSNSGSKRGSSNSMKSRNGEFGGFSPLDFEGKVEENVVLRSPIPWRSRSGRMEMKEDGDGPPLYSLPPSMEDSEFNRFESRSIRLQTSRPRPNSTSPSPNKLSPSPSLSSTKKMSPSPSFSSESQAKNAEDLVRKKIYYKSSAPPPPPPPPLPPSFLHKSPPTKSNSRVAGNQFSSEKEFRRSIRSVPKEFNASEREEILSRANSESELRPRVQSDGSLMGKSVRIIRPSEPVMGAMRGREFGEDGMINGKAEKRSKEVEKATFIERRGDTDKFIRQSVPLLSKQQTFSEYPKEEKKEVLETVVVETDDEDSENEVDDFEGSSEIEEVASNGVGDGGPDVDKKADEFIAKFREQIRLQRIASIRSSTGQIARDSSR